VVEFETPDPALGDEMTTTITLADADGGNELVTAQGWTAMPLSASHEKIRAALIVEVARRKVMTSQ